MRNTSVIRSIARIHLRCPGRFVIRHSGNKRSSGRRKRRDSAHRAMLSLLIQNSVTSDKVFPAEGSKRCFESYLPAAFLSLDSSRGDLRKPIHLPFLVLPTVTSGEDTAASASGPSTATRNRWPRLRICLSGFSLVSMRASPLVLSMAFHSFSQNSM
jgi:hypothetical protein